jgi:hypothetical protein
MTIPLTSTWAELEDTWAGLDSVWVRGTFLRIGLNNVFKDVYEQSFQFSVNRGRNRDLERTNAGTMSASFRNQDRRFDPLNTKSDLNGYVVPRNQVQVWVDGQRVFTGIIDDWNFDYEPGGQSIASFTASDGFSFLARQENAGVSAPAEPAGARINRVLSQTTVNWPENA